MFSNVDEQIFELFRKVENDKYIMTFSRCPNTKKTYHQELISTLDIISVLLDVQIRLDRDYQFSYNNRSQEQIYGDRQKQFTLEELSRFDGSEGKPAYAAVDGIVYDVSTEATWGGGSHFGLLAGKDLTQAFEGCHGAKTILSKLKTVGTLVV